MCPDWGATKITVSNHPVTGDPKSTLELMYRKEFPCEWARAIFVSQSHFTLGIAQHQATRRGDLSRPGYRAHCDTEPYTESVHECCSAS